MRTLANCVAVFFILHFCWSYYHNCYRKGYRIDMWHFVLLQLLFPTSIMLPFNRSPLNIIAFGPVLLKHAMPFVDRAFLISALGYGCVILGGNLWRVDTGLGLRKAYSNLLNQPVRLTLPFIQSRRLLLFAGAMTLVLMAVMLSIYFSIAGFGTNFEKILIVRPALRPFAQFSAFIAISVGGFALGRYEVRRERSMLLLFLLLAVGLFFYGARAFLAGVVEFPIIIRMIRMRTKLNPIYVVCLACFALFASTLLDALRRPHFSPQKVLITAATMIAFGNSFSDTRDFALILSLWDRTFFLGKTYLAGLIAFIPRFISPFRDRWAIGVVTATIAGFRPTEHPGLRVGTFGEAYFNFGILAVIVLGLTVGSLLKYADMRIKEAVVHDPGSVRVYAYFILLSFFGVLTNSVNFSGTYSLLLLLILGLVLIVLSRFIKLPLG